MCGSCKLNDYDGQSENGQNEDQEESQFESETQPRKMAKQYATFDG